MNVCRVIGLVAVMVLLPNVTLASVTINEIAWMGSTDSANHEWIELYNSGTEAVSLDGWALTDEQSLNIALQGSLGAGSYAVLERTSDDTAPGTAFQIYTGALANTGATLQLYNSAGALVDQVAGGENWQLIGGDNATKETAQLTTAGWVTAEATPGATNRTSGKVPSSKESTTSTKSSGTVITKPTERIPRLIPSTKELTLSLSAPATVYVNQPSTFEVVPSAIGTAIVASLTYEWNFGDLATGTGKRVTHVYEYPGEYLVTVRAYYARHDTVAEYLVKVLPVRFSLSENSGGDIQIHNESPYDIDVSGFSLTGVKTKRFPPRSRIAQNSTITVPRTAIGGTKLGQVYLQDATGATVALLKPTSEVFTETNNSPALVSAPDFSTPPDVVAIDTTAVDEAFIFSKASAEILEASPVPEPTAPVEEISEVTESTPLAAAITADVPAINEQWPLFGLVGIILLGLASAYFGTQKT